MNEIQKNRLIELLADQALFGLGKEEAVELNELKRQFPEWENNVSFELAAAAIGLTDLDVAETLPPSLRTKILDDADEFFSRSAGNTQKNVVTFPIKTKETTAASVAKGNLVAAETKRPFWQWLGWAVAAAACVALAVNLWLTSARPPKEIEGVKTVEVVKTPTPELPASAQREQLLASAADVVQTNWTSPKDKEKILGDIVWSSSQQKGYMRFHSLPVNNPNKHTYQLWIVDAARKEKKPVSGGVFDVNETGEVVIPIDAELEIKSPKEFNITKEKPGGVVVSSPERVVALAKV